MLTLDVPVVCEMGDFCQAAATDTRECGSCHGINGYLSRKPNFTGIDPAALPVPG